MRYKNIVYKLLRRLEKPIRLAPNKHYPQRHFTILITAYNNAAYVIPMLQSVINQDYSNATIIYIDDCSTDGSFIQAKEFLENHTQFKSKLIQNKQRVGKLANLYTALHDVPDSTIIIELDGDDYFINNQVLTTFNTYYQTTQAWIIHANYINHPAPLAQQLNLGHFAQQTPFVVQKYRLYRKFPWIYSGLRSYYAALFKRIKKEDLIYNQEFLQFFHDGAMFYPMLEMAGSHVSYIEQPMLLRNIDSPLNDFKKQPTDLKNIRDYVHSRTMYDQLTDLKGV